MDKIAKVMGEYSLANKLLVTRVLVRRVLLVRSVLLVRRGSKINKKRTQLEMTRDCGTVEDRVEDDNTMVPPHKDTAKISAHTTTRRASWVRVITSPRSETSPK